MKCDSCGGVIPADSIHCPYCGMALRPEQRAAVTRPPASGRETSPLELDEADRPNLSLPEIPALPTAPPANPTPYTPPPFTGYQGTVPNYTAMPVAVTNSSMAIVSLVFGILAWVMIPIIGSLVGIFTGHRARREIREAGGRLKGDGLALAGLILSYSSLLIFILACGLFALLAIVGSTVD